MRFHYHACYFPINGDDSNLAVKEQHTYRYVAKSEQTPVNTCSMQFPNAGFLSAEQLLYCIIVHNPNRSKVCFFFFQFVFPPFSYIYIVLTISVLKMSVNFKSMQKLAYKAWLVLSNQHSRLSI